MSGWSKPFLFGKRARRVARCSRCGEEMRQVTAVRFNEDGTLLRHDYDCANKENTRNAQEGGTR